MPCRPVDLRGARGLVGVVVLLAVLAATAAAAPHKARTTARVRTRDLIVLSDLHLGEGHHSPLEDFRVDQAFSDFVDHIIARGVRSGRPAKVVFNGDTFDFLKVVTTSGQDAHPTEKIALEKMRHLLQAHPRVFHAMARLAANGHPLVFVAGNHDQELNFPKVRRLLREHIRMAAGLKSGRAIRFNPHFHLQGDVLVEHGQRYEAANAVHALSWPFTGKGEAHRLRPAASNFLVVEAANQLRRKLPHITSVRRGMPQLIEAIRGAPELIPSWFGLLVRMAFRVGQESATEEARIAGRHDRILRAQMRLNDMRAQVNETRRRKGLGPLSQAELIDLLRKWDTKAARPWLRGSPPVTGIVGGTLQRLAEAVRVVRPSSLRHWTHADETSRVAEGQDFALEHFANVVVNGHTHKAALLRMAGPRTISNSGTWTPIAPTRGGRFDPTAHLTWIEVRGGRVALRRWDTRLKRPALPRKIWPARRT